MEAVKVVVMLLQVSETIEEAIGVVTYSEVVTVDVVTSSPIVEVVLSKVPGVVEGNVPYSAVVVMEVVNASDPTVAVYEEDSSVFVVTKSTAELSEIVVETKYEEYRMSVENVVASDVNDVESDALTELVRGTVSVLVMVFSEEVLLITRSCCVVLVVVSIEIVVEVGSCELFVVDELSAEFVVSITDLVVEKYESEVVVVITDTLSELIVSDIVL